MGLCDSKHFKKSQTYFKESTAVSLTPIINKKNNKKRSKTITFLDTKIHQNEVILNQKSFSPPPKLCFFSSNQSSNVDKLQGQFKGTKEKLNQVIQNKQSKQTLFGKTLRFSHSSNRVQRQLFKPST
ncbi:unnamed protein product [Paramecium pentaurelia]|uniref:Uncharacterized protein n=1 Tax=Paramecium pentaurelia TaxID=43138 RepID=A0A8S1WZQ7_9CILI|nr:unnamed protein product [Paramecium pentaurelia]